MANAELDDLLWAVNSPPLFVDEQEWLDLDDSVDIVAERNGKVGHYFEALIAYWLERIRGCEIVAHRQQVIEAGKTLGELDFVFRDEEGQLNHWETAVKFYLCDPQNRVDGSCYIGPNTADTLERKHRRLMEHQLPLSESLYPEISLRRAFVKGRIYRNPLLEKTEPPSILNPDHLSGVWLRCSQLEWLDGLADCEYRVLEKPFWLAAMSFQSVDVNNLRAGLRSHFESSKKSIHVGISRAGVEIERLFVVADAWPHL